MAGGSPSVLFVGEALRTLRHYAAPVSVIVLGVWLPGHLLVEYLTYQGQPADVGRGLRAVLVIEAILGPFYASGVLCLLGAASDGEEASLGHALRRALRIWPRVFWARLVSGLLVLVGLIALVIPGIVLAVRLAMIDAVVVRERSTPIAAVRRTLQLSRGRSWRIAASLSLASLPFAAFALVAGALQGLLPSLDAWLPSALLGCPADVLMEATAIVLYLHFCDATGRAFPLSGGGPTPGSAPRALPDR
jgi:hypothetical protein